MANKAGRPSCKGKIEQHLKNGDIARWASAGANDKQIAENIGISIDTFVEYKKSYSEFSETLAHARKPVVIEAFEGLVRLSKGFEHTVTRQSKKEVIDKNGNIVTLHEAVQETTYYPPQHQACSKVITNYLNQIKKYGSGVPQEYIAEPSVEQPEQKDGGLPEMDAMYRELFFSRGDIKNDD